MEKFCYDFIRTMEAIRRKRYDFDVGDIFKNVLGIKETPIIAKLKNKCTPKSKNSLIQPMEIFYIFCGIKIWDLRHIKYIKVKDAKMRIKVKDTKERMKVKDAIEVFLFWFHKRYPEKKDELNESTIINNYTDIANKIQNKELQ